MYFTQHAIHRWRQRFTNVNWNDELATAKVASGKYKKRIIAFCKKHKSKMRSDKFEYLISDNGVVFVCDSKEKRVITVFKYAHTTKRNFNTFRKHKK